jgi:hypothetical protein
MSLERYKARVAEWEIKDDENAKWINDTYHLKGALRVKTGDKATDFYRGHVIDTFSGEIVEREFEWPDAVAYASELNRMCARDLH